jgi:ADP-ribosylglycohydrolase
VRVTWVQLEDLVGHELRQAREEGKDVDAVERRWLDAGGPPAPARGASQEPAPPGLVRLAGELLDELAALPRPLADAEPDGFAEIVAAAEADAPHGEPGDLRRALTGAWLGRAVGCVLGKPVESMSRDAIRTLLEAQGRWPLREWFTAEGAPEDTAWNRASRTTSLAENIDGAPEDDDLNFTMLALAILERSPEPTSVDVAKAWLDFLPAGRIFTAERVALRNLLLGLLPPETATYRNPFREWIGARLRVDVYGWAALGDPVRAARLAHEDARVSHTGNGAFAAMFMAAAHAASLWASSAAECADAGLSVVPVDSRLAHALHLARDLRGEWDEVVDALHAALGSLHWVHAIDNTALVAAAMYRFDSFDDAICATVAGGWDTDTNGAAVGSIYGALAGPEGIAPRWTEPLHDRIASSLPGFTDCTISGLAERTLAFLG